MKIKNLVITITSLIIMGCGSSGDSAVSIANGEPTNKKVELIFSENFDSQPDWVSHDALGETSRIPDGWTAVRDGESMYPSSQGGRDSLEILEENSSKAYGGKGKSLVAYRESYRPPDGWLQWNSDGILAKHFKQGSDELYVEFWIRFGDNFVIPGGGHSKIFRIMHSSDFKSNPFKQNVGGNNGPSLFWLYKNEVDYGQRNMIGLRGDPVYAEDGELLYYINAPAIPDSHRSSNRGDYSFNFSTNLNTESPQGGPVYLEDQLNGGYLDRKTDPTHEQVFGKRGTWNKVAFYVKMNSTPGATDGILKQWLNDVQILEMKTIPWHRYNPNIKEMPVWNTVFFGGNDLFRTYPNEDKFEDWYAIDNIKVYNGIPEHAEEDINFNE